MKILSPAGNFESLRMAVYNGAKEVYLGISNFNARNNIEGFSESDLDDIVFFCHIHGVKVNLAVNILFKNEELQDAVNLVVKSYNKGVDCFIIQDLGLASFLHDNYPEIELHASTQMGICNLEGAKYVEKLGFKRVVLARETPLEEIRNIKRNTNLEIEYFVQGALCVCFSGNCYLSSYLCDASGNRGKCKQLCRLPYQLLKNGKVLKDGFLLSAKDFNMTSKLKDLESAGVDVLKIEGRARRPFYVGVATRHYSLALAGQKVSDEDLKLAFNREYTAGYFDGNGNIISNYNNHIGIEIGKVLKFKSGKKFNEIEFSSNRELSKKSAIKIFNGIDEECAISLFDLQKIGKNQYKTTTTNVAKVGSTVRLISDFDFENQVLNEIKKAPLKINVIAYVGEKLHIDATILSHKISMQGNVLEEAKSQALSIEELEDCFNKNEYFDVKIDLQTNGVFVLKSELNKIRREFFECVRRQVLKIGSHDEKIKIIDLKSEATRFEDFEFVENNNNKLVAKNIIYSPEIYNEKDIILFREICKKQNKNMFLDLPNFALDKDVDFLKSIVERNQIPVVCNNYYAIDFKTEKVAGGGLNVYNFLSANKLKMPFICSEDSFAKRTDFAFMTLRHCPMKCLLDASCSSCPYSDGFEYRMQNGKILKLKRKKLSSCTFYLV